MTTMMRTTRTCILLSLAALTACGSDSGSPAASAEDDAATSAVSDAQTPPTSASAMETWLESGAYKSWACEVQIHESRDPSPHGFNRICSNALLAADATGTGNWPKGAAGVKELYAAIDATTPIGYAVYLKTQDDSAGGAKWYWYESIEGDVIADGLGDGGPAKSICVGCHVAAGADADHTPTPGARDQVYTPVPQP